MPDELEHESADDADTTSTDTDLEDESEESQDEQEATTNEDQSEQEDDDKVVVSKNELNALKRLAKKNKSAAPVNEDLVRKIMAEDKIIDDLKEQYPDLDVDAVRKKAKEHNLPIDQAARLVIPTNSPSSRSLGGRTVNEAGTITQEQLDALPMEKYSEMYSKIDSGKIKLIPKSRG